MRCLVCLIAAVATSACTSIDVKPVDPSLNVKHVCIQENPKVTVEGFVPMLEEGFARHGISTQVISPRRTCEYVLTYTALRSFDLAVYLSHAELHLLRNGREIANAEFHLRAKGGFSLTKFKGTKSKMDPVIDQLLAGYKPDEMIVIGDDDESIYSADVAAELQQLEALRDRGIVSEEEYEQEKQALLAATGNSGR